MIFMFRPDQDAFERETWQSQETSRVLAENNNLVGFKRSQAVAMFREKLKKQGTPFTVKDVVGWFSKVKFADSEDNMSEQTVGVHLRVVAKLMAASTSEVGLHRLEQLESHFGRKRPLISSWSLDLVTRIPAREPAAGILTQSVVEGILAGLLRGTWTRTSPGTPLTTG